MLASSRQITMSARHIWLTSRHLSELCCKTIRLHSLLTCSTLFLFYVLCCSLPQCSVLPPCSTCSSLHSLLWIPMHTLLELVLASLSSGFRFACIFPTSLHVTYCLPVGNRALNRMHTVRHRLLHLQTPVWWASLCELSQCSASSSRTLGRHIFVPVVQYAKVPFSIFVYICSLMFTTLFAMAQLFIT